MTYKKITSLSLFVIISISLMAYFFNKRVPDLISPVEVVRNASAPDGGTTYITFEDSNLKKLSFGVIGNLEDKRSEFPLIMSKHLFGYQIPYYVFSGSAKEQAIKQKLILWKPTSNEAGKRVIDYLLDFIEARNPENKIL